MTDAELIAILQQQVADARADTERVIAMHKLAMESLSQEHKEDHERLTWLGFHPGKLECLYSRMCNEDENLREAIDWFMAQKAGS